MPDHRYPVPSAFNDLSLHTFTSAAGSMDLFSQQEAQ